MMADGRENKPTPVSHGCFPSHVLLGGLDRVLLLPVEFPGSIPLHFDSSNGKGHWFGVKVAMWWMMILLNL